MIKFEVCTTCRMVTPVENNACAYYDQDHEIRDMIATLFY